VSYDVAVWEGSPPGDSSSALAEFAARYEKAQTGEEPTPAIRRFVDALLARHGDLTELDAHEIDDSPWADGPLLGNASGPFVYLGLVPSKADQTLPFIVEAARAEGLVAFDPQAGRLLTREPEGGLRRWWRRG